MFTPAELTAEHARAMRIVNAVLAACNARAATARAAREQRMSKGDASWVLSIGKAAIGMAEGIADVCGEPSRHLIVTVDGPAVERLNNVLRSDHPLPTERSLEAARAVKRFIDEAKTAGAPSLTVLISGGASSLICEPIPGVELEEYRQVVRRMLDGGWSIQQVNTVRRAIDAVKGGRLAELAAPLPIDQFLISDVIGDTAHDIGSGPFVWSPTTPEDALELLEHKRCAGGLRNLLTALSFSTRPFGFPAARWTVIAANNGLAVKAAAGVLAAEGIDVFSTRADVATPAEELCVWAAVGDLEAGQAIVWGGEWPVTTRRPGGYGGRCQWIVNALFHSVKEHVCLLAFATDGVDGVAPPGRPPVAGAFVADGMRLARLDAPKPRYAGPGFELALASDDDSELFYWAIDNSYIRLSHTDEHRPAGRPPAQIVTGATGTNVNDLLVAWRSA